MLTPRNDKFKKKAKEVNGVLMREYSKRNNGVIIHENMNPRSHNNLNQVKNSINLWLCREIHYIIKSYQNEPHPPFWHKFIMVTPDQHNPKSVSTKNNLLYMVEKIISCSLILV